MVYNHNDYAVNLHYNSKLCFEGDAKSWNTQKLTDIPKSKNIDANGHTDVIIFTNVFAGTAVVSYTHGANRIYNVCI